MFTLTLRYPSMRIKTELIQNSHNIQNNGT